jgi:hypothetical protein
MNIIMNILDSAVLGVLILILSAIFTLILVNILFGDHKPKSRIKYRDYSYLDIEDLPLKYTEIQADLIVESKDCKYSDLNQENQEMK